VIRALLIGVLIILIARAFWRLMDGVIEAAGGQTATRRRTPPAAAVKLTRDPVCGTYVPPDPALALTVHGTTHYFCSEQCRSTFQNRR
jgi:uncharacterized protein